MHGTTTGEDLFLEVEKTLQCYSLYWNKFQCITVDGGKNMAGLKKGLVGRIMSKLEDLHLRKALFLQCIIHQQTLCLKHLGILCVMKPVVWAVNFIRSHALIHRQFQSFLKEIDAGYSDLPYHTAVRWLSCGKVLLCFYNLQKEINHFLTDKNKADPILSNPVWVSKLSFLVDITSHINDFNLKLQGKENLICDLYRIVNGFRRKLVLFESQLEVKNLSHFPCLKQFCAASARKVNLEFSKKIISDLKQNFSERFSDLDKIEDDVLLFQNPFSCNPSDMPSQLQLELIDLQANGLLKEKHRKGKLLEFYRCLPNDEFLKLRKFASGMASMFGTIYVCEQTFSKPKNVKSKNRTQLTDENLKAILLVQCSHTKPNIL